jgi:hypothetical protein
VAASRQDMATGSAASAARSAATGSSITVATMAARAGHQAAGTASRTRSSSQPRSRTGGQSVVRCRSTSAAVGKRPASRTVLDTHSSRGARCRTARQRPSVPSRTNMTGAGSANVAHAPAGSPRPGCLWCAPGPGAARSAAGPTGRRRRGQRAAGCTRAAPSAPGKDGTGGLPGPPSQRSDQRPRSPARRLSRSSWPRRPLSGRRP